MFAWRNNTYIVLIFFTVMMASRVSLVQFVHVQLLSELPQPTFCTSSDQSIRITMHIITMACSIKLDNIAHQNAVNIQTRQVRWYT